MFSWHHSIAVDSGRLNPGLFDEQGFNEKRLGERLVEMGCISPEQFDQA
jgi:hypothetical protein